MKNGLQKGLMKLGTTFVLVASAAGLNDNKIQAQHPNFTPVPAAKTEVRAVPADSAKKDVVTPNFNAPKTGEDSTKKAITPDMSLDDQARIYSRNNPSVGIAIWKGKDMAKYTDQQMIDFYEGICRDSGVVGKVFIGPTYTANGNTVYVVCVEGHPVGDFMNGNDILSEKGLPRATMIRKGYDNRIKRASMDLTQQ